MVLTVVEDLISLRIKGCLRIICCLWRLIKYVLHVNNKKKKRELDCLIFSWREFDISLVFWWYSCSSFTLASYPNLHDKKWMMQSSTPVWALTWNPGKNHYRQSNKKRVIHHDVLNLMVGRITQDLQLSTAAAVKGDGCW
jgi:hypothetical protein